MPDKSANQSWRERLIHGESGSILAWLKRVRGPVVASVFEAPLPVLLFNQEQLSAHARLIAGAPIVSPRPGPDRLLPRLAGNELKLQDAVERLVEAQQARTHITPAGEWLLDNQHLIQTQIEVARRHLPVGYSRALPHLVDGAFAGFPRVYRLALEVIAHVDGRVDSESLTRFVAAWQETAPLTLGELWAIPIMLRLALLENLRRVAARVEIGMLHRELARDWADQILEAAERDPKRLLLAVSDMARADLPFSNAFVAELVKRLQENGGLVDIPLTWIDHQLAMLGTSLQNRVQGEASDQAANQVSVSSSIGSLRFLDTVVWREFVESLSPVEDVLRQDSAGVHARMEFGSRDRYRHVVEDLARLAGIEEVEVARHAVALARQATDGDDGDVRRSHVGYYLIDRGLPLLLARLPPLPTLARLRLMWSRPALAGVYFGIIIGLTLTFTSVALALLPPLPLVGTLLAALAFAIVSSQLSVLAANFVATAARPPTLLPRMDFSEAIPGSCRTLVVVPTLLGSLAAVERLLEGLEVRYLGNQDENLYFSLLTDFTDAPAATMDGDDALLASIRAGIEALNEKHGADRFFLFHRPRRWNARDGAWMGYERKRGKLEAINRLLRGQECLPGEAEPAFSLILGDLARLRSTAFVITLDTDTGLPLGSGHKLIGTLAHPLNRARFDPKLCRITEGYAILQPRVGIHLPATRRSWYGRLFSGEAGTDPYTQAVSDVYQDLFGEGSFVGKGIYDIDAFAACLEGRLPENLILSHDLIEGCHARSGLVSDVLLYEDHPSCFLDDAARRRRWIRGDWQIVSWLLPWAPGRDGRWRRNPITALGRWKIFDNLRRSLVAPVVLGSTITGLLLLPRSLPVVAMVLGVFFLPPLLGSLISLLRPPERASLLPHLRVEARSALARLARAGLSLAFLPEDARNSIGAIGLSAIRMGFTHRGLLDWRPAVHRASAGLRGFINAMPTGPFLVLGLSAARYLQGGALFDPALILLVPWLLSPLFATWLSAERDERTPPLPQGVEAELRRLSRRTWRFFDHFVGPEDHHLPPDNYQELPVPVIAHRTSPTNIGVSLLANLAAHDFGFVSTRRLLIRTDLTLTTMEGLDRFRGHLYNWYDTRTLKPLPPLYISTVDSGNLIGHMMVLEAGLRGLGEPPLVGPAAWRALADTMDILDELAPSLAEHFSRLRPRLVTPPSTLEATWALAQELEAALASLSPGRVGQYQAPGPAVEPGEAWLGDLVRQARDTVIEPLRSLCGWFLLVPEDAADLPLGLRRDGPVPSLLTLAQQDDVDPLHGQVAPWQLAVRLAREQARGLLARAAALADRVEAFSQQDLDFLYDERRDLFTIGYNVSDHCRDNACYDLLASESRLISFIAIARGQVSQAHWFALGRPVTTWKNQATLRSWSGTMFEYLMPLLVMPTFPGTLLDQTYKTVVSRQIAYASKLGTPWGVSESGYNLVDSHFIYQYRAFGVPGLGLQRGLGDDQVISPYSTALGLMVDPAAASANFEVMRDQGFEGAYGFYEAIDYSPRRQASGALGTVVRSYMAHHQGMSLLALAYALLDRPMQARFRSYASLRAVELLLHERVPRQVTSDPHLDQLIKASPVDASAPPVLFFVNTPHTPRPEVHLLSNGRYSVMITAAGGGYSRWKDLALTRWREDPTRDDWGSFCYIREVSGDAVGEDGSFRRWSAMHQPTGVEADHYEAIFPPSRAEFRRRDHGIDLHSEITVSPEDDIELRRFTLTNLSTSTRVIELTSYAEVVLAPQAADEAHPAFSNLFVQTEILPAAQAILCTRRPRTDEENTPVLFHLLTTNGLVDGELEFETDRRTFLGRCRTTADPAGTMAGSAGSVLDPIVAIRCRLTLPPDAVVRVNLVMGVASTRVEALVLVDKYRDWHSGERVFELARTHHQVALRQLGISDAEANLYLRMASPVVYASSQSRAPAGLLATNRRGQSSLWAYGISGDLPIVLLRVASLDSVDLIRQVIRAHSWWRGLGLAVDLVVWDETEGGYQNALHDLILSVLATGADGALLDVPGGIFVRRLDQFAEADQVLLQTVARILVAGSGGSLDVQIARAGRSLAPVPPLLAARSPLFERPRRGGSHSELKADGFDEGGTAYRITTSHRRRTPAPWSVVLSNPHFGTLVTESGGGYTWCENAHEFRLTPWDNDPVSDRTGEAYYIRDEETGVFWSPTPLPAGGAAPYTTRHRFGSSSFRHINQDIGSEMTMFVAVDAPVKMVLITLTNNSDRPRTLSVTGYCEWALGEHRSRGLLHISSEVLGTNGALLARNPYHPEFGARIGFFDVSERDRSLTGDRSEFLGRNGHPARPAALGRQRLSGRVGAGMDACGAMMAPVKLGPRSSHELVFVLGVGRDIYDIHTLLIRFGTVAEARQALQAVERHWQETLGAVRIQTPDPSLDTLVNGWVPYQIIACRMWARTGFYQSGGAYGFRDQLQDAMALLHIRPTMLRDQIIRCAGRQYIDGDVQHWWHPPLGRGVRTHCSDDYLWLPAAVSRYVSGVGDIGVLDVRVPFVEGRQVKPDEEAYVDLPRSSESWGTVYEHCVRAIQRGLRFGVHGLPLMGTGDWNDGMNLVGARGRGESVWLAFFLFDVLKRFVLVARLHGDEAFAGTCEHEAEALAGRIEASAWDGQWYRRAWFDTGEPLGSKDNTECQIDSLPQSWAVLSGAGDPERAGVAMDAVDERLVDRTLGIVKLFTPPFDRSTPNPGYIRGYVPGVRENGGQYTHAALWAAMAFAERGDPARAWELTTMLNPQTHTRTEPERQRYRVEPYVIAADVYAVEPHGGMGGWTWHTGSAGWMLRLVLESLLGLRLEVDRLSLQPCVPPDWAGFTIHYRYRNTVYELRARPSVTAAASARITVDDVALETPFLTLVDDRAPHVVEVGYPSRGSDTRRTTGTPPSETT